MAPSPMDLWSKWLITEYILFTTDISLTEASRTVILKDEFGEIYFAQNLFMVVVI